MFEFLLMPLWWIARSYWTIIESDLVPSSWLKRLEHAVDSRAASWSLRKKIGVFCMMLLSGMVLWAVIGGLLSVCLWQDWIGVWWVLGIGVVTGYLLVGGTCAAFFMLLAGKVPRRRSPGA